MSLQLHAAMIIMMTLDLIVKILPPCLICTLHYRADTVVGFITAASMYGISDIEEE